ncbi:MerR family transcriptional regulator [Erysipelothrix sp. HDW6B]|uniref:MerR family transcriptional regulator n=1 Tax=Erysipelothrix sp. HDW6B TaxID=2714929 RepID=UPI00140A3B83|nr:MerR family transcriptional regulator [Erysipelothrix sp. HDW6B]QIK86937.1 MerR family transcriptional regulator [Erysipelothrix sp. HDW6B]
MKTRDVEVTVDIPKQTLHFYEAKGLLTVERDTNGYRNYSQENIDSLLLIKYLRDLDFSIRDIQRLFDEKVSLNELLHDKQVSIADLLHKHQELADHIEFIKQKNLPLIPELATFNLKSIDTLLGYWKSTDTVALGRPVTVGYLTRTLITILLAICVLTSALYFSTTKIFGFKESYALVLLIFVGFFIVGIGLFLDDRLGSGAPYPASRFDYVEFTETGINYYKNAGFLNNIRFIRSILDHKPAYGTKSYQDIASVDISVKHRFMKPVGYATFGPAIRTESADFTFTFEDGTTLFLLAPMILSDDAQFISVILYSKVKHLHDPSNFLDPKKDHYS